MNSFTFRTKFRANDSAQDEVKPTEGNLIKEITSTPGKIDRMIKIRSNEYDSALECQRKPKLYIIRAMRIFISKTFLILFFGVASLVHAQTPEEKLFGNAKAKALLHDGNVLWSQQKVNEAFEKFRLAGEADPKASGPWSNAAALYLFVSKHTDAKYAEEYRNMANAFASKALTLFSADPLAQETLRELTTPSANKSQEFDSEAISLFNEGESFFQRSDFRAALKKYELAFAKDATFAKAILYAGDCYFHLGEFNEADLRYHKALDIDPQNYQAWRFLAHAQFKLGHAPEVIKLSLLKSIEIQPNYIPAWDWYAALSEADGVPLQTLDIKRLAKAKVAQNGAEKSYTVEVDSSVNQVEKDSDSTTWLHYGIAKATLLAGGTINEEAQRNLNSDGYLSAFESELLAWKEVFSAKEKSLPLKSPLLKQIRQFVIDNEIEAAIFVFFFEESFRADFEKWKKAHPTGIQKFITKYALRPSPAK